VLITRGGDSVMNLGVKPNLSITGTQQFRLHETKLIMSDACRRRENKCNICSQE
jgi:hypothetical protein